MSVFEFLFKYKPIVYSKGHLGFQLLSSPWFFLAFVAVAVAGAIYAYRSIAGDKRSPLMIGLQMPSASVERSAQARPGSRALASTVIG